MGPIDAVWHLLNFFGPAIGIGLIAPSIAKLLWRRELRSVPWRVLATRTTVVAALTWAAGLVVFGRDGRMVSYGALVCACALTLAWAGFGARLR